MRDTLQVWIVTIAALVSSGGCTTIKESLTNRVVCTVNQDRGFVASMWGFFGIVTDIDVKDRQLICASKVAGEAK